VEFEEAELIWYILFVTSNHQRILFFSIFFHKIFSVLAVEKEKKTFYWSKIRYLGD
jgi:hypothetical protein